MDYAIAPVVDGAAEAADPALLAALRQRPPREAALLLGGKPPTAAVAALLRLNPRFSQDILAELPAELRAAIFHHASEPTVRQWVRNEHFPNDSVGRMMDPVVAAFAPETLVGDTIETLRTLVKTAFITYCYVTDPGRRLIGLVTMRDLLLADRDAQLDMIMLRNVFSLKPDMTLADAMRAVLDRHYPAYPVCDDAGVLVGLVRGQAMFEEQAIEITAQAGAMVGVEREERLSTPLVKSLKFRHPWLQINLLTAFIAAAVVGVFQDTIDRLVILALFLPVLAGQSGNTGCQALAVTVRGLTLGELKSDRQKAVVWKEAGLGLANGALVGVSAAVGMFLVATWQHSSHALALALAVFLAMVGSCVISGVAGALIPLTLKRLGADPATASSIVLTTMTDVVSMGLLLGLATVLVR